MISKKTKAIVLLSGGLDSILAVKVLQEQGIEVMGLSFQSCFFNCEQAKKAAKSLGINIMIEDFSKEHLEMVKNPKYGYGKTMNPCIDCHALMLKKAKIIMEKEGFDFIATGEVLAQRPMSQNKKALKIVEQESGLLGRLIRPLSAKLLKKTVLEDKGLVDREKLLDISGRSRQRQMALAKKKKIKEYPSPAGGCILTDSEFSKKLKDLFIIYPFCQSNDIKLLRIGRHFWQGRNKIIIGRNEQENLKIKELVQNKDILIELQDYSGPLTLVRNYGCKKQEDKEKAINKAKYLTKYYSPKAREKFKKTKSFPRFFIKEEGVTQLMDTF